MYTLKDLAQAVGLDKRAARVRLEALGRDFLEGHVGKTGRNTKIYDDYVLHALKRLEELRRTFHLSVGDAARRVLRELEEGEMGRTEAPAGVKKSAPAGQQVLYDVAALQARIKELDCLLYTSPSPRD